MAEFFLSIDAFERFAKNHLWEKILVKNQIFLDIDHNSWDSLQKEESSYISNFQRMSDTSVLPAKNDIIDMMNDHSLFYQHPFGIFILDMSSNEAEKIQKETGVFCMPTQKFLENVKAEPDSPKVATSNEEKNQKETGVLPISLDGLTYRRSIQFEKGQSNDEKPKPHDWKTFLEKIKKFPSNCIVINDRYLFGSDQKSLSLGVSNIVNILKEILPKKLIYGEYHILIIYDITANPNPDIIESIASEILREIKPIRQQLDLRLEIVGAKNDVTHNRWIATNYGIFSADHKLAAFDKGSFDKGSYACADQSIVYKGLFSEGLTTDDESDFPINTQNLFLKRIKKLIDDAASSYLFWVGNEKRSGSNGAHAIINRLIYPEKKQ